MILEKIQWKSPFMISMSFVGWKERDFKWNEENDRK